MKIAIVLGTRPEIIKLSSIIRYLNENSTIEYYIIHTNQHYSDSLDAIFFRDLKLEAPKYNLNVGSGTHGQQIGKMLKGLEEIFLKDKPDVVFVQGDTNSVFAGALMASRFSIKIAHVEAGLRSYDRNMPEEVNRILTDSISDYFFCPTQKQRDILKSEGKNSDKIFVVGNTVVDAVLWAKDQDSNVLIDNNLEEKSYCLVTIHRAENVDDEQRLRFLLKQLGALEKENLVFPIHPRTEKMIEKYGIKIPDNIRVIEPVGFLDMVSLELNSKMILTDSGGIQEEACILNVPCITLRTTTERPETIDVGGNILMSDNIKEDFDRMSKVGSTWDNPFGDGKAGEKIVKIVMEEE